jgi:hypothetical protein
LEGIGIRGVCEAQGHAEFTIIVPNVPKASRNPALLVERSDCEIAFS